MDVRDYLAVRYFPDAERAGAYLRKVIPATDVPGSDAPPVDLLTRAAHDACYARGEREIAICLTGGLDSRSVLGAALETYPASSIHCYTIGATDANDRRTAERVARRVGVRHTSIHPRTVDWDLDRVFSLAERRWQDSGLHLPIDGLVFFDHLARHIPPELLVLTGHFALCAKCDSASPKVRAGLSPSQEEEIDRFLMYHRVLFDGRRRPELRAVFQGFLERHRDLAEKWPHLSTVEQLDYGFRNGLWLRPVVTGSFPRHVALYEDPRVVAHWLSIPLVDRAGGKLYARVLEERFGESLLINRTNSTLQSVVNALEPLSHRLSPRLRGRLRRLAFDPHRDFLRTRGDPREHRSMRATLRELCAGFDRRGIRPDRSLAKDLEALLKGSWDRIGPVRWAASAEAYLRMGALSFSGSAPPR